MRALAYAVVANVVFALALAAIHPMEISGRGQLAIFLSDVLTNAAVFVSATLVVAAIGWVLTSLTRMSRLVAYLIGGILVGAAALAASSYGLMEVEDVSSRSVVAAAMLVIPVGAGLGVVLWLCAWMASNNALERERGQ